MVQHNTPPTTNFNGSGQHEQQTQHHPPEGFRQGAARKRTLAFFWMRTVGLDINDIIEAVYGTGSKRKGEKDRQRNAKFAAIEQIAVKKQRQKYKGVLHPLMRPQNTDNMYQNFNSFHLFGQVLS